VQKFAASKRPSKLSRQLESYRTELITVESELYTLRKALGLELKRLYWGEVVTRKTVIDNLAARERKLLTAIHNAEKKLREKELRG
jgi:hypothetical protein